MLKEKGIFLEFGTRKKKSYMKPSPTPHIQTPNHNKPFTIYFKYHHVYGGYMAGQV